MTYDLSKDLSLKFYKKMLTIRRAEETIGEMVAAREIVCPAHLYIGQEASAVGACANLNDSDYIFSTHRAHGHFLAKGGSLKALFAEVLCRRDGCSGGRGGSMHLVCPEKGILGTSSIVGGCLPIGVGAAMSAKMKKDNRISVVFFGDGAMDEGVFFEVLNFAVLKKLPALFFCENNYYATHMQICRRLPCDSEKRGPMQCDCGLLSKRVAPFNVPTKIIDGYNVLEVYEEAKKAVEYVRDGNGPFFIEATTYRWRGHVGPNWDVDMGLRTEEEIDLWVKKCTIDNLKNKLLSDYQVSVEELQKIEDAVEDEIKESVEYGRNSPRPSAETLLNNLYSE